MFTHLGQTRHGSRTVAWLSVLGLLIAMIAASVQPAAASTASAELSIVVREAAPDTDTVEGLVGSLGGTVTRQLPIIGGFAAHIPADVVDRLRSDASVYSVTPDVSMAPRECEADDGGYVGTCWGGERVASLEEVARTIGANKYWRSGLGGDGVDIAVIDTGVSPVDGLDDPGRIINGPDLSFESQNSQFQYLDTNGHGTHMAGIIGANDRSDDARLRGIAYKSRIVNIKVGAHDGSVDISQTIAAIDWVVQHKNDNGLDIRVLNLSYGTDSLQDPSVDPLSFAVEQAWKAGIVVVVAAGNDGGAVPLNNPATNPYVIAVGATDIKGDTRVGNDEVAAFSNCGVGRTVDVVAPGKSIASLWVENSSADIDHPEGRETFSGDGFRWDMFKGSGTSQAAAVVSGAAALIIDQRPDITPDQVKQLLIDSARPVSGSAACQGAGQIDLAAAKGMPTPAMLAAAQTYADATGLGSLQEARGTHVVGLDGSDDLQGEQDIHGQEWDSVEWVTAFLNGTSWSSGEWNGTSWSGTSWSGLSWSGLSWSGLSWSGLSWSGTSWSNQVWNGTSWSGLSWSGTSWSGSSWSGSSWSAGSWGDAVAGLRWD